MKKILTLILAILVLSSVVFAEGQGNMQESDESGNQAEMMEENEMQQQGEETPTLIMEQERKQLREHSPEDIREMVQQRQKEMNQEMEGMDDDRQKMFQNQNRVRSAVHALLDMEGMMGGIGPMVRDIARNFNNSIKETVDAEEMIQKRSGFKRFFAGGDHKSAEKLEEKTNQNKERIQELKQLKEECDCNSEVKALMQEQIQKMDQEQIRLGELAQKEKKGKGMFGWLWK